MKLTPEETKTLAKLLADIRAIQTNPVIFEWFCGNCRQAFDPTIEPPTDTCCATPAVDKVFVGKGTGDPVAWDAAGELLDLVERAQPFLARLL